MDDPVTGAGRDTLRVLAAEMGEKLAALVNAVPLFHTAPTAGCRVVPAALIAARRRSRLLQVRRTPRMAMTAITL